MTTPESLERRIDELRVAIRCAVAAGDRSQAGELRAVLRQAEGSWDDLVAELDRRRGHADADAAPKRGPTENDHAARPAEAEPPGALLSVREQVHQALTLIGVPAAPRLISAVHEAFSSAPLIAARLTSLRRDEERSFRSAPYARAYYLCAALTADLLAPARGLLAVSTWPLERRVIGPLSPRVNFLTAAIAVVDSITRIPDPGPGAAALLWRFAVNIPGAQRGHGRAEPARVAEAARAELGVHLESDRAHRQAAAQRARIQLDDPGQLFGSWLRTAGGTAAG
ncbi:MAG: hypothetical protein ACRDOK_05310 [Streptosporangiaceae bacterium]